MTDLSATASPSAATTSSRTPRSGPIFFQEQLSWNDRVFITGAVRVDNNSAFGSDVQLVAYPKLSASWVVSDEPGWASTGSMGSGSARRSANRENSRRCSRPSRNYQAVTIGGGQPGVSPAFLGNPDLKPERGQEIEAGFEASLFKSKLGIDATFYNKKTKDAILQRVLAPSLGFPGNQFVNIGSLQNRGFELGLRFSAINKESTHLDLGFNWARNDNKVLDLGEIGTIVVPSNMDTPSIVLHHQEGLPAGSWFGRKVISADLDVNGIAQNVLCDAGSPSGKPSGTGIPATRRPTCSSDAPIRGTWVPSWHAHHLQSLTLYGLVDFRLDVYHGDNDRVIRCGIFQTCHDYYDPRSATEAAEFQSNLNVTSYAVQPASFAKLREVSASLALPASWTRAWRECRFHHPVGTEPLYLEQVDLARSGDHVGHQSVRQEPTDVHAATGPVRHLHQAHVLAPSGEQEIETC